MMRKKFETASKICVIFLLCDSWIVYCGIHDHLDMWPFIVFYWAVLTLKNLSDYLAGRVADENA